MLFPAILLDLGFWLRVGGLDHLRVSFLYFACLFHLFILG